MRTPRRMYLVLAIAVAATHVALAQRLATAPSQNAFATIAVPAVVALRAVSAPLLTMRQPNVVEIAEDLVFGSNIDADMYVGAVDDATRLLEAGIRVAVRGARTAFESMPAGGDAGVAIGHVNRGPENHLRVIFRLESEHPVRAADVCVTATYRAVTGAGVGVQVIRAVGAPRPR